MGLERWSTAWLRALRAERKSVRTIEKYRQVLRSFGSYLEHDRIVPTLDSLNRNVARGWAIWLREVPREHPLTKRPLLASDNTVKDYLSVLKAWSHWLSEEDGTGLNGRDPLEKLVAGTRTLPEINPLSEAEFNALLAAVDRGRHRVRDKALLLFMVDSMLRVSEVVSIEVGDIEWDHEDGTASVSLVGKGGKPRSVTLGLGASAALETWLMSNPKMGGRPKTRNLALWVRGDGQHMTADTIRIWLAKLGQRAGLHRKVHPHLLRHTGASERAANGMPDRSLRNMLGHSRGSMTDRYVNLAERRGKIAKHAKEASPVDTWGVGPKRPRRIRKAQAQGE